MLSELSPVKSGKVVTIFALLALPSVFAQEKSDEELVKELSNPGNVYSDLRSDESNNAPKITKPSLLD